MVLAPVLHGVQSFCAGWRLARGLQSDINSSMHAHLFPFPPVPLTPDVEEEQQEEGVEACDLEEDDYLHDSCSICDDGGDLLMCAACPCTFCRRCLESGPAGWVAAARSLDSGMPGGVAQAHGNSDIEGSVRSK